MFDISEMSTPRPSRPLRDQGLELLQVTETGAEGTYTLLNAHGLGVASSSLRLCPTWPPPRSRYVIKSP